ncbi:hypothetical protein T4D_1292 [Trichinella pseudospiralis]|uniref:HTH CENPB-type domain-containing protein n=1 Tax=Trichinella pseudospiralis TaxID=6337 RepID=A0A0V1F9J1_TRIPS|nr:hypothetical protein T4D_1292 [Trichinella pseudospiralis]
MLGQGKKADGQLIYGSCGPMIPELMVSLANYADVSGSSEPALSDWQSTIQVFLFTVVVSPFVMSSKGASAIACSLKYIEEKVEMLNKLNSGINFVAVGGMFRINKRNAYCIHKNKEAIHATLTICTSLPIKPLRKCALLTSSAIREKGRFLYGRFKQAETSESSRPTFTASKGWLDHFKRCFLLRNIKMSREAISEYQLAASSYPEELKPLIEKRPSFARECLTGHLWKKNSIIFQDLRQGKIN